MRIITEEISINELKDMPGNYFDEMIKGVIDIKREILALDAPMHADEEAVLIENGSRQDDLWGINIYPLNDNNNLIEFESLINIKPQLNNRSITIQSKEIKERINSILDKMIKR